MQKKFYIILKIKNFMIENEEKIHFIKMEKYGIIKNDCIIVL